MKLPGAVNPFTSGLQQTFRGLRTGDPQMILVGAAWLAWVWLRRQPSGRELMMRRTLKPGDALQISVRDPA